MNLDTIKARRVEIRRTGIHSISYPIWGPQDVVDSQIVDKQIEAAKSSKADG